MMNRLKLILDSIHKWLSDTSEETILDRFLIMGLFFTFLGLLFGILLAFVSLFIWIISFDLSPIYFLCFGIFIAILNFVGIILRTKKYRTLFPNKKISDD